MLNIIACATPAIVLSELQAPSLDIWEACKDLSTIAGSIVDKVVHLCFIFRTYQLYFGSIEGYCTAFCANQIFEHYILHWRIKQILLFDQIMICLKIFRQNSILKSIDVLSELADCIASQFEVDLTIVVLYLRNLIFENWLAE